MARLGFRLRFNVTVIFLLTLLVSFTAPLYAQSAEPKVVHVASYVCPPFVMNDNNQFSGISIFLWENIAEELGLDYEIKQY